MCEPYQAKSCSVYEFAGTLLTLCNLFGFGGKLYTIVSWYTKLWDSYGTACDGSNK